MMMQRRRVVHMAAMVAVAACGRSLTPAAAPVHAPVIAMPGQDSSPPALQDAAPRSEESASVPAVVIPDSLSSSLERSIASVGAALGIPPLSIGETAAQPVEAEAVSWDLDVLSYATQEHVARYVTLFSGSARERIQSRLSRGKAYEPMIREKFRSRGIPEDLYYLALVESGYDPHAYSRAAAVGMWQFMSSTARGVGLRVDHWVDERRDPVRATDAAGKFLNMLYQQFGSYYLAAAAYNGGPGRVSRGLARFQDELEEVAGDDRFFALAQQSYLRPETRNYVPQLIAAALIGKEPARYGLSVVDAAPPFAYDSVRVPALTSLGLVAELIGRPVAEVRDLNSHLLRGVTPPSGDDQLRLPVGSRELFETAWDTLPADTRRAFSTVRAKKGQTLAALARANGVDARRLAWYNPGLSSTKRLPAGREVLVPAVHVIAASRDVPNPSIERYGSAPSGANRVVHVVRRGESLGLIARRYRTTVAGLQRANGLKRTVVYPGQTIIIRTAGSRARPVAQRGVSAQAKKKPATRGKATAAKAVAPSKGAGAPKKGAKATQSSVPRPR
ncbi:MAG: transglycosylase SLT domain-containing protein [Gemmatimonadetes bacterium]|nr:transglycosylase SLT domain-containing protein [Gemmatimonadota bacterium]